MTEPFLLVGGPVAKRGWILDRWFDHVETAIRRQDVVGYRYIFGVDINDKDTIRVIERRAKKSVTFVPVNDPQNAGLRNWGIPERKKHMVYVRNEVLHAVRRANPSTFLSLDSDILLHPDAISSMLELKNSGGWDAVGGKCYMTPLPKGPVPNSAHRGTAAPSYLIEGRAGNFRRVDPEGPAAFPVDIIMAIKMMTPAAYSVDYAYHAHGEDIGWCRAARAKGLRLAWDGRVTSKHVMLPEHLDMIDPRCGF